MSAPRHRGYWGAAVAATGLALGGATPAVAAPDPLALSWDGRSWHPRLDGELFVTAQRWVPGDAARSGFRVRNGSSDPARLTVEISADDTDRLLVERHLELGARVAGRWVAVRSEPTTLPEAVLAPGTEVEVVVRARLRTDSGNASQRDRVPVQVAVRLSGTGDDDARGPHSELPGIGSAVAGWQVVLGAVLAGVGLGLLARRRPAQGDGDG